MSIRIHERALVHPRARIGPDCEIGPDVSIEEHVEIGPGCRIQAHAVLTGHTRLGSGNKVGYGAIIGAEPQDLSYRGATSFTLIGDGNTIREYATIHRGAKEGSSTEIGNDCYVMAGAHIAHNCKIQDRAILANNVLLGGYVEIGERVFLGGAAVVHQFVRIGALAMVRGQTRLGLDVPPYCMAVDTNTIRGLNVVGLKRNGFDKARRRPVERAYALLFHSGLNRVQAIEAIGAALTPDNGDIERFVGFLEGTKRGICGAAQPVKERGSIFQSGEISSDDPTDAP